MIGARFPKARPPIAKRREPTMMLINVVFLLLAFFVIAGTLAQNPPQGLTLMSLAAGERAQLRDVVVLTAAGVPVWPKGAADAASFMAGLPEDAQAIARILPDRDAPATALVALAQSLTGAGAQQVRLMAEQE